MSKSVFITARIEPHLKQKAEAVLHELGISRTQAITMLYKRLEKYQEWPWKLKILNAETQQALKETDKGIGLVECDSADNLFKELGINED